MGYNRILLIAALAGGALAAGAASARVYDLSYTVTGVGPVDLVLTTQNNLSQGAYGDLGYQVIGISGTRNGVAVTGLSTAYSADNYVFTSSPNLDYAGLSYDTGSSAFGLFWGNAPRSRAAPGSYGECYASGCNFGVANTYNGVTGLTLSPVGVPEPASWALMLIGVAGLGAAMRGRKGAALAS